MAIQIALATGAEVFATDSPRKLNFVAQLGATPIDYTALSVEQYIDAYTNSEGFDVVYDTVGGATLDASFLAVKMYTGHVVSSLGWGTHKLAPLSFRGATYSGVFTLLPLLTGKWYKHHSDILQEATRLAEAGKLKPLLDTQEFTLETAHDAHAAIENRTALGKIVVNIGD